MTPKRKTLYKAIKIHNAGSAIKRHEPECPLCVYFKDVEYKDDFGFGLGFWVDIRLPVIIGKYFTFPISWGDEKLERFLAVPATAMELFRYRRNNQIKP